MRQYYIFKNNQNVGPLTAEQLVQQGLSPNTPVWTEGMPKWTTASNVPELMAIMMSEDSNSTKKITPPALPPNQQTFDLPQNQQPVQQPQPQSPYQRPNQPLTTKISTQTKFKFVLCAILAFTAIVGLVMFINSFTFFNKYLKMVASFVDVSFTLFGILALISSVAIIAISVVLALRIIKRQKFAFLSFAFFATTFLLALLDILLVGSWSVFILLMIAGVIGLGVTYFAAVPTEHITDPNSFKAIMAEKTQVDIVIVIIYGVLMLGLLIVGLTTDYLGIILDNFSLAKIGLTILEGADKIRHIPMRHMPF